MDIQNKEQWEQVFLKACQAGNLEDVRHLCQKQYVEKGWSNIHNWNGEGFRVACFDGRLNIVKYLLTTPELIEAGHTFADLHANNDEGLRVACAHGHLEVVKYLLTSPELKESGHSFANLHVMNEYGFRVACENGHLDIVKYLLTSQELKEAGHSFADLHTSNEYGLRWACVNEHWNIVKWLVMDYGIEKTPAIAEFIRNYHQAKEYFQAREELKEIQALIKETSTYHQGNKEDGRAAKKAKKL